MTHQVRSVQMSDFRWKRAFPFISGNKEWNKSNINARHVDHIVVQSDVCWIRQPNERIETLQYLTAINLKFFLCAVRYKITSCKYTFSKVVRLYFLFKYLIDVL